MKSYTESKQEQGRWSVGTYLQFKCQLEAKVGLYSILETLQNQIYFLLI